MNSNELREKFLEFFKEKGHAIIPGASLIPENDPTVLFTTAGMHPLVSFLLGEKHPGGKRLVNVQKCIRTGDIDEVGDSVHLTFFEMLGNWSLGDFWKKEAIEWNFEFLTKVLKLPLEKIAVSCFAGEKDVPKDEESAKIWESLGIPRERIYFLGRNDNWWGPAGQTGPCGPDTEMFYWTGKEEPPDLVTGDNKEGWVEIWNDVFMQYNKTGEGRFEQLKQKNVDTGMGLERTLAVLNGYEGVYETELFTPIIKKIEEISRKKYQENIKAFRIIADHLKAASFILAEKVEPSNIERGYVLRRLIRRAARYGKLLGIEDVFTSKVTEAVVQIYKDIYPEISENKDFIYNQLAKEEEKFEETLEKGLKEFKSQIENLPSKKISGNIVFNLYQSYGFPLEATKELAQEQGFEIDEKGFESEFQKHQELSRTASAGMFKGGLADMSIETTKLHTAAHLMLAGLRRVLSDNVIQKGSNITSERLRFDFSYKEKMTPDQLKQVEDFVNEAIDKKLPVKFEEMSLDEAKKMNAMGVFESRYGEKVKVYIIGEEKDIISKEICGGPHVNNTSELGKFKIIKEESSSAGVRRIKAILNKNIKT